MSYRPIDDYKKIYELIYSKINLEAVLQYYNIEYKSYFGSKGKEYSCACPFHDDMSPSFSIHHDSGVYNCFVCGGGDFVKFIKNLENLKSTKEALEFIKIQVGINETIDVFSIVNSSVNRFVKDEKQVELLDEELKEITLPTSESAEKYFDIVKKRVVLEDIKKYGMRYCVDDRVFHERLIIPVYIDNKLVTFAARDMSGKSDIWAKVKEIIRQKKLPKQDRQELIEKYLYKKILYPFGTQMNKMFFNWDEAIKHKEVVICEGIFDALKIIRFGYNALALLSCHLNAYKAKQLMQNFEIVYIALDNDDKIDANGKNSNPGQEAAQKMMKEHLTDIQTFNIVLPLGKDPDDCTKEEFDNAFQHSKNMQNMFTLSLH